MYCTFPNSPFINIPPSPVKPTNPCRPCEPLISQYRIGVSLWLHPSSWTSKPFIAPSSWHSCPGWWQVAVANRFKTCNTTIAWTSSCNSSLFLQNSVSQTFSRSLPVIPNFMFGVGYCLLGTGKSLHTDGRKEWFELEKEGEEHSSYTSTWKLTEYIDNVLGACIL